MKKVRSTYLLCTNFFLEPTKTRQVNLITKSDEDISFLRKHAETQTLQELHIATVEISVC